MFRIAVDFDGTIVENAYPKIGKPRPFAFETLKAFQSKGCALILWTCREGKLLEEAVEFCRRKGIEFYAVNKNFPDEQSIEETCRKIDANFYFDDKSVPPFEGWGEAYHFVFPDAPLPQKRKRFFLFKNDEY